MQIVDFNRGHQPLVAGEAQDQETPLEAKAFPAK